MFYGLRKPVAITLTSIFIAACGGGDGGAGGDGETMAPVEESSTINEDSAVISQDFSITDENFIAAAAAVLLNIEVFTSLTDLLVESGLLGVGYIIDPLPAEDCQYSGSTLITTNKNSALFGVDEGDSIRFEYDACAERGKTRDGSSTYEVFRVMGDYPGSDYAIRSIVQHDVWVSNHDHGNGQSQYFYEHVLAYHEASDTQYTAMNIDVLRSFGQTLTAANFASYGQAVLAEPSGAEFIFSDPVVQLDRLAYEIVSGETDGKTTKRKQWNIDSHYVGDQQGMNYASHTTSDFYTESYTNESGEKEGLASGSWEVTFKSGEIVTVDCEIATGCVISFSKDGNRENVLIESMTFNAFRAELANSIFTSIAL